jgi:hypothetical protein
MTDNPNDPWSSLADELGVQPGHEPPPPAPQSSTPPPQRSQPPSHHAPPPKKAQADWNALAGELGIELPPDSGPKSGNDPVAELLGFPPPSDLPPKPDRAENRSADEDYRGRYDEQDDDRPARNRWQDEGGGAEGRASFDDTKPVYFDESTEGSSSRERPQGEDERSYRPSRGRRGRGGRGRGGNRDGNREGGNRGRASGDRGGNRGRADRGSSDNRQGSNNRSGGQSRERPPYDDRPYAEREPQADRPFEADLGDRPAESGEEFSSDNRPSENRQGAYGEQPPRRRRRRRGRGGARQRDEQQTRRPQAESRPSEDDEIPFLELASDEELTTEEDVAAVDFSADDAGLHVESDRHEERSAHSAGDDDIDDHDDAAFSEADENHSGKAAVRDIITWQEAIGMIIDGNMQSRSHAPEHHGSQSPRGSRGHGRGRGGRGGRRR